MYREINARAYGPLFMASRVCKASAANTARRVMVPDWDTATHASLHRARFTLNLFCLFLLFSCLYSFLLSFFLSFFLVSFFSSLIHSFTLLHLVHFSARPFKNDFPSFPPLFLSLFLLLLLLFFYASDWNRCAVCMHVRARKKANDGKTQNRDVINFTVSHQSRNIQ